MSIDQYNGGTTVAMKGKNCVGIACDLRLGTRFLQVTNNFTKVFKIQDNILLGLAGLATDVETFSGQLQYKVNLYNLKEQRPMKPSVFANLVAHSLFERRFGNYFVSPIVAGIQNGKPYLASYDSIGALANHENFFVGGTGAEMAIGLCEAAYKEDLTIDDLKNSLSETIRSVIDRDILSGGGACVYMIGEHGIEASRVADVACCQ